ncbi:MAG: trehalose-6-phosphate synthase [Candidatus Eisenbacteria bacterium]|nr:trehalose-6-phosphate synthase [Candidatus Eisenbacteria bacterium]
MAEAPIERLVVVSNRLPIVLSKDDGAWHVEPGSGGLVTALAPVLKDRGGLWIGWPGTTYEEGLNDALRSHEDSVGYSLVPISLTAREVEQHYRGFSNEVVWPLFHDLQSRCNFDPDYWTTYQEVNRRFAEVIAENTGPGDFVWVHDYHLLLVARELRKMGYEGKLGYFLHIPFPPLDIFIKLPWRSEVLSALLDYDLVGFQTMRDRRNFVHSVRSLVSETGSCGRGQVCDLEVPPKQLRIGAFPISIDYDEFEGMAKSSEVSERAWHIHEKFPNQQIILGVDRMDYTKGITYRLHAYRDALRRYPDLQHRVTLVQVVVPSRRGIPEYEQLKIEIERLVSEINGEFTTHGWVPIHYIYRSLTRPELIAYYRTAEIALITPLKDGMNLVAKEYCASSLEESGVLILSEFAGAVGELQHEAVLVNPYDVHGVADGIHRALHMDPWERHARMHRLRRLVKRHDIFWWVDSFLEASISRNLDSFPVLQEFTPGIDAETA